MTPDTSTPPSYARAATQTLSPYQRQGLLEPPPTSLTLVAALQALQEQSVGQTVYLLEPHYLNNWFVWALHQKVPDYEKARVREALRLAALKYGLVPPNEGIEYENPGPIDSTPLAVEGHPLILSPLVEVLQPKEMYLAMTHTVSESGLPELSPATTPSTPDSEITKNQEPIGCLAVPEVFYETLRSVHGVVCEDGYSVSFQRYVGDSERILLHHLHQVKKTEREETVGMMNGGSRPVEFRRKVILQPANQAKKEPTSLMEKLMLEEKQLRREMVPTVEVHPIKLMYSTVHDHEADDVSTISSRVSSSSTVNNLNGFVLVSRDSAAVDALMALQRVAAPNKATGSARLWSRQVYPHATDQPVHRQATATGDGYEVVDLEALAEKIGGRHVTVKEWIKRHLVESTTRELEVLVETRRTVNSQWPRAGLELENRIQVGDFVDAQDVAGKWYDAVVRSVDDDVVEVHYAGWASRWDTKVRRRQDLEPVEGVSNKIKTPAPLWSRTGRWRERLCVGDTVEIRDSSSLVQRPKWYKGIVRKIGKASDPVREIEGGAEVEEYEVEGDPSKKEKLLLLGRTQQILVEVEEERGDKSNTVPTSPGEGDLAAGLNPEPPFLRWVNLYGEEICRMNTHLKDDDSSRPVTLQYEFEKNRKPVEVLKSHPSLGSGFMRESLRGSPPAPGSVGLHNLGNSCFLNSTIQCLNHIEPLTQYFLKDRYYGDLNWANPLGSGGNVALAYASLLKKMWSGNYSILAPRLLKLSVANFAPQFDNTYQHDSQEFCQFLMDGLHEDLNRVKNKPYVEELEGFGMKDQWTAVESWRKHLLRHDSVIVDHCQGMHRSHLTCPRCGRESIKFDVYSSISLPLIKFKDQHVIELEDCIEKFMEGEQLDERNAWYCPSCRQHVCALKMIALWSVPDILILHLKRFTFDTCMISGGMLRAKIDSKVEFPIEGLDLTKHVLGPIDKDAPPIYKLFGVSEHSGPTANTGHYTATVRNSIDDQWYRCNDSHVGQTSGEAAITGGAYVLFYQRVKGTSKWAGMHKVMQERNIDPYGGLETDQEGFKKVKKKKKKGKEI